MSQPLLDLNGIKSLFSKGMEYAKNNFPKGLYNIDEELCDYQLSLVNKATDLTTVMNAIGIRNSVISTAYKGPKPICNGCEIQYNPIQFGVGNSGWYFNYGVAGNISFVFGLTRSEIAPPDVVKNENIPPEEAVRWILGGGFGVTGGPWYNFPAEIIYMKYSQPTYSTFSLTGGGNQIKTASLSNAQPNPLLSTTNPMQFTMTADFISPTDGKEHKIDITMISNTPPTPNVANSCGMCVNNMGSLYYSYTDMDIIVTVDGGQPQTGKGWIDHQTMKSGIVKGLMNQAKTTFTNMLVKPVTGGWLWYAIQDYESDTQYMFTHFFISKFYKDDIKLNENIPMHLVNVYKKGVAHFSPTRTDMDIGDVSVKMVKTVNVNGLDLPAEYEITLPGGKSVVLTIASSPDVFLTTIASYECPALLFDSTRTKQIGIGLIEANYYLTNDELAKRYINYAGGDTNDMKAQQLISRALSPTGNQTTWQKILAVLIVLIPLCILIAFMIFIFYRKDKRHIRLMISIALLLILYGVTYSPN